MGYTGAISLHEALAWERPYLSEALSLILETENADGLQVVLGMMRSSVNWCHARKAYMFSNILNRVKVPSVAYTAAASSWHAGTPSVVDTSRWAVLEVVTELIEEMKDQALKTTFLEPTKMHFRNNDLVTQESVVDTHGANTYIAVLAATLGVQLNRRPHLRDKAQGVFDFLKEMPTPSIWAEEYFGKDWNSSQALRAQMGARGEEEGSHHFVELAGFYLETVFRDHNFVFDGATPLDIANCAIDPSSHPDKRKHMAKYLEMFAYWFSESFMVPRMISRLTGESGRVEALQILMNDLLACEPALVGCSGEEDVRFWLWDMGELPAVFRTARAKRLLQHAGVLRV